MTDFIDSLKIAALEFRLNIPREFSRTRGGLSIPSLLGFPYWQGMASISPSYHADAAYEVDLMRLERPGQVFEVYDARFNGPRADPGGVELGSASPVLAGVSSNNQSIQISGLPSGYVISPGDYVGWQNADGTRALHRALQGATASGGGITPAFAVEGLVRPGTATGAAITLVRPTCRAIITEASYGRGRPLITDGASFNWQQTNT